MGVWMGGWTDGQIQVWCGRGRCRNGWEWWQRRLKSGSFLARASECLALWLFGSASRSCLLLLRAAVEVAFLFTPFPIGKQHSRLQDAFLWGRLQGGGTAPVALPFGMWVVLACMRWHIPPKI